jgi:hypothetical protein
MPSQAYQLFRQAVLTEKQVTCTYRGRYRELCPVIIGHADGEEKVLAFQFGGDSTSRLPPGGEWRCLFLAKVSNINLRDGPWHEGIQHQSEQTCVREVDLDINIHVRRRRSASLR